MKGQVASVLRELREATEKLRTIECRADCDVCGTKQMAKYSARVTPVGSSRVGGKSDYLACCASCFYKKCYFTNPVALLANPEFFLENRGEVLAATELTPSAFCEAVGAAIVALRQGHPLEPIHCPECNLMHLDTESFAVKLHHEHLCEWCNVVSDHGHSAIGNPLAVLKLTLV
jgi:hypothetical protein